MNSYISALALTIAAVVATAAAYMAYRAFLRAATNCSEAIRLADLAVDKASSAVAALRLEIESVSSSRASRLAEEALARSSAFSASQALAVPSWVGDVLYSPASTASLTAASSCRSNSAKAEATCGGGKGCGITETPNV